MEKYKTWLLSPKGRITRTQFWLGLLIWIPILFVAAIPLIIASSMNFNSLAIFFGIFLFVVFLLLIWSQIALCIKRLHDLDFSGWWTIAVFVIPFVVFIVGLMPTKRGDNRFGADPKANA